MTDHLNVSQLHRATELTRAWLLDLATHEPFTDEEAAYTVLRAVLHALRDRMAAQQVVQLGAQLPLLIRGVYFEGWRPTASPGGWTSGDEFYRQVEANVAEFPLARHVDVEAGTRLVLAFLAREIDPVQLRHVEAQLPEEIRRMMVGPAAA